MSIVRRRWVGINAPLDIAARSSLNFRRDASVRSSSALGVFAKARYGGDGRHLGGLADNDMNPHSAHYASPSTQQLIPTTRRLLRN